MQTTTLKIRGKSYVLLIPETRDDRLCNAKIAIAERLWKPGYAFIYWYMNILQKPQKKSYQLALLRPEDGCDFVATLCWINPYVFGLYVKANFRRNGIGTALVKYFKPYLNNRRYDSANRVARAFFKSVGVEGTRY